MYINKQREKGVAMNIAAQTRFKHGGLYSALKQLGWSQAELARRTEMHQTRIGEIINLRRRPKQGIAYKIEAAFGEEGICLDILEEWPQEFKGFKKSPTVTQYKEVPLDNLLQMDEPVSQLISSEDAMDYDYIHEQISKLPELDQYVFNEFYFKERSQSEVAECMGKCTSWTMTRFKAAMNKLYHLCKEVPGQSNVPVITDRANHPKPMERAVEEIHYGYPPTPYDTRIRIKQYRFFCSIVNAGRTVVIYAISPITVDGVKYRFVELDTESDFDSRGREENQITVSVKLKTHQKNNDKKVKRFKLCKILWFTHFPEIREMMRMMNTNLKDNPTVMIPANLRGSMVEWFRKNLITLIKQLS